MATDVNNQMAMMAAMGQVKDVSIDPNSGRAVKRSNKSILEKVGVKPVEYVQSNGETDPEKIKEYKKTKKQDAKDGIAIYMESIMGTKTITESEDGINYDEPLGVGTRIDESDYMASLVKQCKKRR